jgi:hypothetical protein
VGSVVSGRILSVSTLILNPWSGGNDGQRLRITVKALPDAFERDSTHTVEIELSLAEVGYLVDAALGKLDVRRLRAFADQSSDVFIVQAFSSVNCTEYPRFLMPANKRQLRAVRCLQPVWPLPLGRARQNPG